MAAIIEQEGANLVDPSGDIRFTTMVLLDEQIAENTICYRYTKSIGTTMSFGEAAAAFADAIQATYCATFTNLATFVGVKASQVENPLTLMPGLASVGAAGTAGLVALPRQACGILTLKTNIVGPAGRGRLYLPFPATDDDDGQGIPSAGYLTKLTNLKIDLFTFNAVVGLTATYNFAISLYSRSLGASHLLTTMTRRQKWATQKRRGSYGRANSSPF